MTSVGADIRNYIFSEIVFGSIWYIYLVQVLLTVKVVCCGTLNSINHNTLNSFLMYYL